MQATLRPMSLGEILDRTFEIYRKRFFAFASLSAIPALVLIFLEAADRFWWKTHPPEMTRLFGVFNIGVPLVMLLYLHVSMMLQLFIYPSITHLCSSEYLGKPSSFSNSLRAAFSDWRSNVALSLAQIVVGLVLPEVVCLVLFAGAAALEAALKIDTTALGNAFALNFLIIVVMGIVGYFWMWSYAAFSWAGYENESLTVGPAMRRSFSLTRGRRRAIFLSQLIPAAIWWALGFALTLAARFLYFGLREVTSTSTIALPVYVALTLLNRWVVEAVVGPVFPIMMTLFYFDQRVRKEGFDLEKMMEAAGWTDGPIVGQVASDPEPASPA